MHNVNLVQIMLHNCCYQPATRYRGAARIKRVWGQGQGANETAIPNCQQYFRASTLTFVHAIAIVLELEHYPIGSLVAQLGSTGYLSG